MNLLSLTEFYRDLLITSKGFDNFCATININRIQLRKEK